MTSKFATDQTANLRTGPGMEFEILGWIKAGNGPNVCYTTVTKTE